MNKKKVTLGPDHTLTPEKVFKIAFNNNFKVGLSKAAKQKIKESRGLVDKVSEEEVIYGVNTGFGALSDEKIEKKDIEKLQRNLVRSHNCAVGDNFDKETVRAITVVRLNSLCQGYSGIRLKTAEFLKEMINKNLVPVVPSQGSVGSSGDLAPLAHLAIVLIGEGEAYYKGERLPAQEALDAAGFKKVDLRAKEGLALINGTSVMTAIGALALHRAEKLIDLADMSCALSLEAVRGCSDAFDEKIHEIRPHPGQKQSARKILSFIQGSQLVDSDSDRVQDSYSLRCAPQVHGSVRDSLTHIHEVLETELNSVTDNPAIFPDQEEVLSGGNFHGEPIAIVMDLFSSSISELANISERRTAKLINPSTSEGLPAFLIPEKASGLNSGLMIPQYTAASLVSENKGLAHPASVDSIPTSADKEDHVSMGTTAARRAEEILENSEKVLAIEYLTALQAIDFRGEEKLGQATSEVYELVREEVPFIEEDRPLAKDINRTKKVVMDKNKLEDILNSN